MMTMRPRELGILRVGEGILGRLQGVSEVQVIG
jgi:hypothetical protein